MVTHTFQIHNKGTADLNLTGTPKVTISGAAASDFSVQAVPHSPLAPNTHTAFTIRFRPNALGLRHATVSISSSDPAGDPYTFAVQGRGTQTPAPHIQLQGNHHVIANGDLSPTPADLTNFGSLVSSQGNVAHTFQVHNGGTSDLSLNGITISGPAAGDFNVTTNPSSQVAAGSQTAFTVLFSPSVNGARKAVVTVASSDKANPSYTFAIQGRGTAAPVPHIQLLGENHLIANGDNSPNPADNSDFGSVAISDGSDHKFVIRNSGTAELALTGTPKVTISGPAAGDFSVIVAPGSPLAARTQTAFVIHFEPSAAGLREANISISSSDNAHDPYTFAIQGQGTEVPQPQIDLLGHGNLIANGSTEASAVDGTLFGTVVVGKTKEQVFSVRNSGAADLFLTGTPFVQISGSGASQFNVTAQPGSPIGAGHESHFTISYTPDEGGQSAKATVTISSIDAGRSPYAFVIEGHGGMHMLYFPVMPANN